VEGHKGKKRNDTKGEYEMKGCTRELNKWNQRRLLILIIEILKIEMRLRLDIDIEQ
jgi:hypothetical protein